MSHKTRVVLFTIASIMALVSFVGFIILAAPYTNIHFGNETGTGQTNITLGLLILGTVMAIALLTVLVGIGWSDLFESKGSGQLYVPMLIQAVGIFIVLLITGIRAYDLLSHNLTQKWVRMNQPEIQLLSSFGFLMIIAAQWGKNDVLLQGRKVTQKTINIILFTLLVIATFIILSAVL